MNSTLRSTRKLAAVLGLALLAMVCISCSGDDNPVNSNSAPTGNPSFVKFQGNYVTNHRWGGAGGTWVYSIPMEITSMGEVFYNGKQIKNPVFGGNELSWSRADSNATNAWMVVQDSSSASFFWSDKGSVDKRCAMGWIQNAGEGKLDFRGLIQ